MERENSPDCPDGRILGIKSCSIALKNNNKNNKNLKNKELFIHGKLSNFAEWTQKGAQ